MCGRRAHVVILSHVAHQLWMRSYMIVRKVRKELQSRGETREFEGVTSVCTSVSPAPTGFSNFVEKIRRTLFHMRAKSARCEGRSK